MCVKSDKQASYVVSLGAVQVPASGLDLGAMSLCDT